MENSFLIYGFYQDESGLFVHVIFVLFYNNPAVFSMEAVLFVFVKGTDMYSSVVLPVVVFLR